MAEAYSHKRDLIKQSALKIFSHYGYQKSTLEDIANQLGIKKNTLYYYFKSKEAIFNEILNDEVSILLKDLQKLADKNQKVYKKLSEIYHLLIYFGRDRFTLYSISIEAFIEIGDLINQSFTEIRQAIQRIISGVLKTAIDNGELKKHDHNELAKELIETLSAYEFKDYRMQVNLKSLLDVDLSHTERRINLITKYIIDGLSKI